MTAARDVRYSRSSPSASSTSI